ncbi:MAG: PadR family transcriptional regulator [Oscillospiraceae bacterium]|nr:PadR family transcriptional regulator [Oscillospiraceae bacterium]
MDIQIKKGILDVLVLTILNRGNSYGYKIIQDIAGIIEISESTLYPILKRLENGSCLTTYSAEHNGRLRKYYSITELGKRRIREFLSEFREVMTVYNLILKESTGV